MRKILGLALVVAILALGGAAFAMTCPDNCDINAIIAGCPDQVNVPGHFQVNYKLFPFNYIQVDDPCLSFCIPIGCTDYTTFPQVVHYKAWATGGSQRKIVGQIDSAFTDPAVSLWVNLGRPDSTGNSNGWKQLGTIPVDLVSGISQICAANGTGLVSIAAGQAALPQSGQKTVTLTIQDM